MSAPRIPSTPAVLALRAAGVRLAAHFHECEEHGGTAVSSRKPGVDGHAVRAALLNAVAVEVAVPQ